MSEEADTRLLDLPTEFSVPSGHAEAVSKIDVDRKSASRMLWVLILFAWVLAGAVLGSALLGYGTKFSNLLAGGWFGLMSMLLVWWPRMDTVWHQRIAVLILILLISRWAAAWLYAEAADAVIGVILGLLYTPVLVVINTLLWGRYTALIGVSTGLVMGLVAIVGSSREALAAAHLDDWRIGPLVLVVYGLFAWLLRIWVGERDELRSASERVDRLTRAANTDTLTGLANRRVAERALSQFADGRRRYAVMMIDIDHFKSINDQYGHDVGDRILQGIADTLRQRLRASDMLARWGGEEFLVIVESVSRDESSRIAESLRQTVDEASNNEIGCTISIGVAHSNSGQSADEILKRADEGLYAAKNTGRNKVVTV